MLEFAEKGSGTKKKKGNANKRIVDRIDFEEVKRITLEHSSCDKSIDAEKSLKR